MKKYFFLFAGVAFFLFVGAQNGFAHSVMSQGCTVSGCHSQATVHAGTTHATLSCDKCHQTVAGGGDAYPSKCIACHPRGNVGACNLVKFTSHASVSPSCISCHGDKNVVTTPCSTSSCPAAKVLGDADPRLATLRQFRDKVLAKSVFGKGIINMYYNNADAINASLEKNPTLKAFSYKALQSFIPVAEIFM